ncbi:hypothetical protein F4804DRAFT_13927 [Jackrogersella minutella]|nr:hypothetical protein F4804DRAFT_13927 [Jackrogersella minutella]
MREAIKNARNGFRDISTLLWILLVKVLFNLMGAKPRVIKDVPKGFDDQDIKIANGEDTKAAQMLAPSSRNKENTYQIGIAFVGRGGGSLLRGGHAEIVIRDGDGLSKISPPSDLNLTVSSSTIDQNDLTRSGPYALFNTDGVRLRVCHIHNTNDRIDSLELTLEERPKVQYYKYLDLYRIRMTERRLKYLALRSCPQKYTILVDDCATYCRVFLDKLLDYLLERGKGRGGIDRDQYSHQKCRLRHACHIEDGWAGKMECRTASPVQLELDINDR